jgi:hypothetical protein
MPSRCAWIVYVHIASVFAFLLLHGPSAVVSFALRGKGDPAQLGLLGRGLFRASHPNLDP